jgi:hypothetical protein
MFAKRLVFGIALGIVVAGTGTMAATAGQTTPTAAQSTGSMVLAGSVLPAGDEIPKPIGG